MATTQRPRTPRRAAPPAGPNPASRGLILIVAGVVLGIILLVKGGGVGFDSTSTGVTIPEGDAASTTVAPATTAAPVGKAPQTVQVVAGNGSSVSGLAGKTGQFLAQAGYTQVVATDSLQPVTATVVYFAPGFEGNAEAIGTLLNLQAGQVQALPAGAALAKNQPATAGVVVLIGPELATVVGAAAAGGTATTVAGATATTVAGNRATTATTATTTP